MRNASAAERLEREKKYIENQKLALEKAEEKRLKKEAAAAEKQKQLEEDLAKVEEFKGGEIANLSLT